MQSEARRFPRGLAMAAIANPVTVYLDASFEVVSVEAGGPGQHSWSNASFSA